MNATNSTDFSSRKPIRLGRRPQEGSNMGYYKGAAIFSLNKKPHLSRFPLATAVLALVNPQFAVDECASPFTYLPAYQCGSKR